MIGKTKFKPLRDRVLIENIKEEEVTQGGIYKPNDVERKFKKGTVIAVGTGKLDREGKEIPLEINIGNTVYFAKYAGTELDDNYLVLSEADILGIIDE